jgi:hypothetical protein
MKNKFRPVKKYKIIIHGEGNAMDIITEMKAFIKYYEEDKVMPTGELEGPFLAIKIEQTNALKDREVPH